MAATANSLRLCLRTCSQTPRIRASRQQINSLRRTLSTSVARCNAGLKETEGDDAEFERAKHYENFGEVLRDFATSDNLTKAERLKAVQMLEHWKNIPNDQLAQLDRLNKDFLHAIAPLKRPVKAKKGSFWNTDETDMDLITDEVGEDDFEEDDITSLGHAKLEEHREYREYARIAVWEMPLLSKLAKPFEPPADDQVLRFRYTTYMGEYHPADRKVVVEFCPKDLGDLTEAQQLKLMKLAGARYNPEKEIIKMSCEKFEHQAQNKRYLGDLVGKLIAAAKDPADTFEDIPLDTRHHKFKVRHRFPKEWLLTEERKKELEAGRKQAMLLDEAKKAEGGLIDGVQRIQEALAAPVEAAEPQLIVAKRSPAQPGKPQMRRARR